MQTNPIDPVTFCSQLFSFHLASPSHTSDGGKNHKRQQSKQYGLLLIWSSFRSVMHLYGTCSFRISISLICCLKSSFCLPPYSSSEALVFFVIVGVYFLGGINLIGALFVGIASTSHSLEDDISTNKEKKSFRCANEKKKLLKAALGKIRGEFVIIRLPNG